MTHVRPAGPGDERGRLANAGGLTARTNRGHLARAARTVAGNATDAEDCRTLLSMLGLEPEDRMRDRLPAQQQDHEAVDCTAALTRGLAAYLHAVAAAVGVPIEGTSYEVSDTATAYLALVHRMSDRPGRDLMLVWSERDGWAVSVETAPLEPPVVLSFLGGDPVPEPRTVARFVHEVLAGRRGGNCPTESRGRTRLTERLTAYTGAADLLLVDGQASRL